MRQRRAEGIQKKVRLSLSVVQGVKVKTGACLHLTCYTYNPLEYFLTLICGYSPKASLCFLSVFDP